MANGELQSLVNFRQPLNSTLRAAPYKLVLSDSPYYVDFRTLVGSDLDGTPFKPYGMYIDNTQGTENLIILFQETQYRVVCKKGEVLNTSYPAADYAIAAITGNGPASIIFVDYSVEPYSSNLTGGSAMAIWGAITGTLSNQTDLQAALDGKVDKVAGFGLSQNSYTNAEKTKLAGIESGAQVNTVTSVAGKTGAVTLIKGDVGLGNVDNTSDANKPISTAQQTALDNKVDKVAGLGLSQNSYTNAEKTKLAGIEAGAQVNVVTSVAGKTGAVTLVKGDVALGNVDNTSDANKPVSTAQATAIAQRYGPNNILNAVSQSGGVPTGGVIERGSNANGNWTKYADGTMECWRLSATISWTMGSSGSWVWALPVTFASVLTMAGFCTLATNSPHAFNAAINIDSTTQVTAYVGSMNFSASGQCYIFIRGRWF